jgi:hypothetical protein
MSEPFFRPTLLNRRRFLRLASLGTAGTALAAYSGGEFGDRLLAAFALSSEFPVDPYISQQEHLDSLYPPNLSFYKQPWRGYLETVPARQFLSGIGINYALPDGSNHEPVVRFLADSGIRHIRVEIGWSQVSWAEDELADRDKYAAIFAACKQHGVMPLILLNAHHGIPGPNRFYQRQVLSGGQIGSRSVVLNSVANLISGRSGLSNLGQYKMCDPLITDIDAGSGTVNLSRPLPVALADGSNVTIHTLKYLPLHPVGYPQFDATMGGWRRYIELALEQVADAGIDQFEIEIWNELTFGSDFLSINNYYESPIVDEGDLRAPGGSAWELGNLTADFVKRSFPGSGVVWGFSNTDYYHTPIRDLPAGVDAQSYHPYATNRQQIPADFPPPEHRPRFMEGFVPSLSWCMPEGSAHLGTTPESLALRLLQPRLRNLEKPPGVNSFSHYMTEHGFVAKEAGITDRNQAQSYKARALIRALPFWLNKGLSRIDIYTLYEDSDDLTGLLWADPKPPDYGPGGPPPSPALTALRNLTRQFDGAEDIAEPRQLSVRVTGLGDQPEVFQGGNGYPPLYYRQLFTFLPFQVHARRFVVATYVMSYDITSPPPPIPFRLEVAGVDGPQASIRYYDPILDRDMDASPDDGYTTDSVTLTLEQVEYPRLLIISEAPLP